MSDSPAEHGAGVGALRWSVCPGTGRVAHLGNVVVVTVPESIAQLAFATSLLTAAETAASAVPGSATVLFRELSGLVIGTRADSVAPFGVIADDGDRLAVLLCGAVTLDVLIAGGQPERMSGADATTYLDRRLTGQVERLLLTGTGAASPDSGSDLRLGVVPGAGLAASARTAVRAMDAITPVPAADASPSATPVPVGMTQPAEPARLPEPAQTQPQLPTTAPAEPAPAEPAAAEPVGLATTASAPAGGFAAAVMAPPPAEAARHRVPSGPRNVVLSAGDTLAAELTRDVIVGRQPALAPDVGSGAADPFEITDTSVSRIHARISINSEGVWITDLGSANGTRTLAPNATAWDVVVPHTMTALEPGTRILFGACEAHCDFTPAGSNAVPASLMVVARAASGATGPAGGIADYAFIRSLGGSYHGELYLAVPPARLELGAEFVVVKVITGLTSDDAFGRAVRELRAYASVESPYLLTVHDAGNDAGRFFYSMPYLRRGSLATAAESLPAPNVMRAVAQVAQATHALHEAGILHLGIAPSTILLGDGAAYLADVGATQSIVRQQTLSGISSLRQVEFLEPQILLGERGTRASDIWSLGATLYRTLARVSIYGEFPDEPLLAIRTALTSKPTLPVALEEPVMAVVRRCVDEVVASRFATAAEIAEAIESAMPT